MLLKINSIFSIYEIFEKQCNAPFVDLLCLCILILRCGGNGVLQLVSEQVGPSDQLVESRRA